MTVIYALKDPDTAEVRYIGKAVNLVARLRHHRWDRRNGTRKTAKQSWLSSLTEDPEVDVLEVISDSGNWSERERYWIAHYTAAGARLTNMTTGGDGWRNPNGHSEETRAKLREMALARGAKPPSQLGRKASAETRERLRESAKTRGVTPPPRGGWNKGQKMSDENIEKNRAGHKGKPWSEARRLAQINRNNTRKLVIP